MRHTAIFLGVLSLLAFGAQPAFADGHDRGDRHEHRGRPAGRAHQGNQGNRGYQENQGNRANRGNRGNRGRAHARPAGDAWRRGPQGRPLNRAPEWNRNQDRRARQNAERSRRNAERARRNANRARYNAARWHRAAQNRADADRLYRSWRHPDRNWHGVGRVGHAPRVRWQRDWDDDDFGRYRPRHGWRSPTWWPGITVGFGGWVNHRYGNGRPWFQGYYRAGRPDGWVRAWYQNGQLRYQGYFRFGVPDGWVQTWYPNGQLRDQGRYHNGIRVGWWQGWHRNGAQRYQGYYANGAPAGWWTRWSPEGEMLGQSWRG